MQAYGFRGKFNSEAAYVTELMKMYQKLPEKGSKRLIRLLGWLGREICAMANKGEECGVLNPNIAPHN